MNSYQQFLRIGQNGVHQLARYVPPPAVISDGETFRFAAIAALTQTATLALFLAILRPFGGLLDCAALLPGAAAFLFVTATRMRGLTQMRPAELSLLAGNLYACAFLPLFIFLTDRTSPGYATCMVLAGVATLLLHYPWRSTLVLVGMGGLSAAIAAAGVWVIRGTLPPTEVLMRGALLAPLATLFVLRAMTDRTTKDKVLAVKITTDTIAHEMRTPMASIEASCEGMTNAFKRFLMRTLTAEQRENPYAQLAVLNMNNAIGRIKKDAADMHASLNLVLQNASDPKSIPPDTQVIPKISDMIKQFISAYPSYGSDFMDAIRVIVTSDFSVKASPKTLEHVFFNLIKNSLHSIQKAGKGQIEIFVESSADQNLIRFRDSGSGIPKASLAKIFSPFYTTRSNGTGLGLPFCRNALMLFGAEITVESVEKEFAEFTIHFPKIEN